MFSILLLSMVTNTRIATSMSIEIIDSFLLFLFLNLGLALNLDNNRISIQKLIVLIVVFAFIMVDFCIHLHNIIQEVTRTSWTANCQRLGYSLLGMVLGHMLLRLLRSDDFLLWLVVLLVNRLFLILLLILRLFLVIPSISHFIIFSISPLTISSLKIKNLLLLGTSPWPKRQTFSNLVNYLRERLDKCSIHDRFFILMIIISIFILEICMVLLMFVLSVELLHDGRWILDNVTRYKVVGYVYMGVWCVILYWWRDAFHKIVRLWVCAVVLYDVGRGICLLGVIDMLV